MRFLCFLLPALVLSGPVRAEDEKVFSGPQVGEKLVSFKTVGVYDKLKNKDFDPITDAGKKPTVIVFVHQLTRPGFAVIRALTAYAKSQEKKDIKLYLVWLTADRSETESFLNRVKGLLNIGFPVVISKDGAEGPGAYGLNRKMTLTVLVGKENKVTANFALIQPSVQADAPKVATAMAKLIDVKAPTAEELANLAFPARPIQMHWRQFLNKNARPQQIQRLAAAIEKTVKDNKELQQILGRMSTTAVERKQGSEAAQEYVKKWAKAYGTSSDR